MAKFFVEVVRGTAGDPSRWESEEAYAEHVEEVGEAGRAACRREAGKCCMNLTLESFDLGEETDDCEPVSGTARVEANAGSNCPDTSHILTTLKKVADGTEGDVPVNYGISYTPAPSVQ